MTKSITLRPRRLPVCVATSDLLEDASLILARGRPSLRKAANWSAQRGVAALNWGLASCCRCLELDSPQSARPFAWRCRQRRVELRRQATQRAGALARVAIADLSADAGSINNFLPVSSAVNSICVDMLRHACGYDPANAGRETRAIQDGSAGFERPRPRWLRTCMRSSLCGFAATLNCDGLCYDPVGPQGLEKLSAKRAAKSAGKLSSHTAGEF